MLFVLFLSVFLGLAQCAEISGTDGMIEKDLLAARLKRRSRKSCTPKKIYESGQNKPSMTGTQTISPNTSITNTDTGS